LIVNIHRILLPYLHCSVPNRKDSLSPSKTLLAESNTEISLMWLWERPEPVIYCTFIQLLAPDCTGPCRAYLGTEAEEKIKV